MTNNNTFMDKEPIAISSITSRKGNLVYELLLTSYLNDESNEQYLMYNFFISSTCAMSENNKIKMATKNVMDLYSDKEPSAEMTVSDKDGKPLYKMSLVSHAKNNSLYEGHLRRFEESCYIVKSHTSDRIH